MTFPRRFPNNEVDHAEHFRPHAPDVRIVKARLKLYCVEHEQFSVPAFAADTRDLGSTGIKPRAVRFQN